VGVKSVSVKKNVIVIVAHVVKVAHRPSNPKAPRSGVKSSLLTSINKRLILTIGVNLK